MSKISDYAMTLPPEVGASMMEICAGPLQKLIKEQRLNPGSMTSLIEELKVKEPRVDWGVAVVHLLDSILGL